MSLHGTKVHFRFEAKRLFCFEKLKIEIICNAKLNFTNSTLRSKAIAGSRLIFGRFFGNSSQLELAVFEFFFLDFGLSFF